MAFSGHAAAEPYLAVANGLQCSACHSHPAGGGKRNAYGNAFAQSELSAKRIGAENAEFWTGDVVKWLSVGADLRASLSYVDVPNAETQSEFNVTRGTLYVEANIIKDRLSLYIDQQIAPSSSINREAYIKLKDRGGNFHLAAGQFYIPYGLRLQDDTAFIRLVTGINFTNPDRGVQVGYENGQWSTLLSVTNGSGGGSETDSGKQIGFLANYVRRNWRAGISFNTNNADAGDRQMYNAFFGLKTGPIVWLAEIDKIQDELPNSGKQDAIASLIEGNWLFRKGHNLKISYDYFDPDDDVDEDHQSRWSLVWEHSPIQFLQARFGIRLYDGVPQVDTQNRDEAFIELHGYF
jgi:hypothetical protein